MKKYLLAGLAFLITFFLSILIGVLINRGTGIEITKYLAATTSISMAGLVFAKYKKTVVPGKGGISRTDRKAFEEALRDFDFAHAGIEEMIVTNGKEGASDFVIGIRTVNNIQLNYENIKNELYKKFFKKTVFVFINLNAMDKERNNFLAGGTRIKK